MKNPLTRRIQIQWIVATAFAVVGITGCTAISGTLTWNKRYPILPLKVIGTQGGPNPQTLEHQINLQAIQIRQDRDRLVGRVTYGKVSISGREVSVPYFVDDLPLPTPISGPVTIRICAEPAPGGAFLHDRSSSTGNDVTLTSSVPITGFDLDYDPPPAEFIFPCRRGPPPPRPR
jgi:hypothetical protein